MVYERLLDHQLRYAAGMTASQVEAMRVLQRQYDAGAYPLDRDDCEDAGRIIFTRWLVEHGRINEDSG